MTAIQNELCLYIVRECPLLFCQSNSGDETGEKRQIIRSKEGEEDGDKEASDFQIEGPREAG